MTPEAVREKYAASAEREQLEDLRTAIKTAETVETDLQRQDGQLLANQRYLDGQPFSHKTTAMIDAVRAEREALGKRQYGHCAGLTTMRSTRDAAKLVAKELLRQLVSSMPDRAQADALVAELLGSDPVHTPPVYWLPHR
jgi:hypothetical protein